MMGWAKERGTLLASAELKHVAVDFRIYGVTRSFRKVLFSRATGGVMSRESRRIVTVRAPMTFRCI